MPCFDGGEFDYGIHGSMRVDDDALCGVGLGICDRLACGNGVGYGYTSRNE